MDWLNYHHLLYFHAVARDGTLARASRRLGLAQSTVSGQIRTLEESLGEKLFTRRGRGLVLTETGRVVYRYADEIFSLGRQLREAVNDRTDSGRPISLVVGVADVVPKLVVRQLLAPALQMTTPVHLVVREDKPEPLLAALAIHDLDIVISDAPLPPSIRVRAFSHLLSECELSFFATPALAKVHKRGFPGSLDGAPMLLPTHNTTQRRSLDEWFVAHGIRPKVVAEFEDSALLKVFGQTGLGIFPASEFIAADVERQYQVRRVGTVDGAREQFYAISMERKLQHPAVVAISESSRSR